MSTTNHTWPDELEIALTGVAQGGDAVGHHEGRAVFASGGWAGERVRVRLHDRQRAFARGRVVEVLAASPDRQPSTCPLEQRCGAGDWRWVALDAQRRAKQEILRDQLTHLGGLDLGDLAIGLTASADPALAWGYRTTAELHFANGHLGYYAPGSRRVADVPACCLHHPLINDALAALRPLLTPPLPLAGVTVRCSPGDGTVLGILDLARPIPPPQLQQLTERWQRAYPALVGVVSSLRSSYRTVRGQDFLTHELAGLPLHVSAGSFFQVNGHILPRMVERVHALVEPQATDRLLDVFCGVGTFGLPLAREVREVVGVEGYAPAIADARLTARATRLANTTWHAGAAEEVVPSLGGSWDAVVLDPPRRGCEPAVLQALLAAAPRRIVYVACHPGTLARDCKLLVAGGYRLTHAEVIDLFPQTHHVESIVRLERN